MTAQDLGQPDLFGDWDVEQAAEDEDLVLDLRVDDSAWTSCRYCQTLTTAAGIHRRGHGPGAETCARMVALAEVADADPS